jgi:hypothetical protein
VVTRRLLIAGLILLLTGCGVQPSAVILGAPAPRGQVSGTALYLVFNGKLTLVLRPTSGNPLDLLAAGPTDQERSQGFTSDVPPDIAPVSVVDTIVTVSTDVSALSTMAVDQIVCTAGASVTLVGQGHSRGPVNCPN